MKRSLLILFIVLFVAVFWESEKAACKGFLGMKSARREVWQLFSDADEKYIDSLRNGDLFSGEDLEKTISEAEEAIKLQNDAPRHKFASGRIFRPESTFLGIPFKQMIMKYLEVGDIEKACGVAREYVQLSRDFKMIVFGDMVFDSIADEDIFNGLIGNDYISLETEEFINSCEKGPGKERVSNDAFFSNTLKHMAEYVKKESALEERLAVHEKLPREEAEMYVNFLDFSARAYNAADPDEALRIAAGQKEFIDKRYKDFKFESGRGYREESTFLLDAYVSEARAYADKGDCERAKSALAKFNEIAAKDYLVIDYFYFKVYDAALDAAVYAEKKKHNVQILLMSLPRSACFD